MVDAEVKRILDEAFARARSILEADMDTLHRMADALLERETLDRDEVDLLAKGQDLPPRIPSESAATPEPKREAKAPALAPGSRPVLGTPPAEPAGA